MALACPNLTRFCFKQSRQALWPLWAASQINDADLAALAEGCPQLTSLSLKHHAVTTDDGFASLLSKSSTLTDLKLNFHGSFLSSPFLSRFEGRGFASAVGPLTSLTLSGCMSLVYGGLHAALRRISPQLQELTLSNCRLGDPYEPQALNQDLMALIFNHCSQLRKLRLCKVYHHADLTEASKELMDWPKLPCLQSLHVLSCDIPSIRLDNGWQALAAASPALEVLCFTPSKTIPLQTPVQEIICREHERWQSLRSITISEHVETHHIIPELQEILVSRPSMTVHFA